MVLNSEAGRRMTQKTLSGKQERAAVLVAEDELSNEDIARQCGVTRKTVDRWKTEPEFKARVSQIIRDLSENLERYAIARRDLRVAEYNERRRLLIEVRRQRAEQLKDEAPGGDTGLIVRQVKVIGGGRDAELVTEYAVDTGLLKAQLDLEKQAAIEAGQWLEKKDVTSGGESLGSALERAMGTVFDVRVADAADIPADSPPNT